MQTGSSASSQKAGRSHQKENNQKDVSDHFGKLGSQKQRCESLDDSENQAAEQSAQVVSRSSQDNHQERFEDIVSAHFREDREHDGDQAAADSSQSGGEAEGEEIDAPDIDAADLSQLAVLGGCADRLTGFSFVKKKEGQDCDAQSEAECDQARFGHGDRTQKKRAGQELHGAVVSGPGDHRHVGEKDRDAEGEDEGRKLRSPHHPRDEKSLQESADEKKQREGDDKREKWIHSVEREEPEGRVASQHEQGPVSDIDDPHHPKDEGHSQGHHGVEAAGQEAAHDSLEDHGPCDLDRHRCTLLSSI